MIDYQEKIKNINFQNPLEQHLLKNYINKGSMDFYLKPNYVKDNLNLNISEIDLRCLIMSIQHIINETVYFQRELHYGPIREKAEKEGTSYRHSLISHSVDCLIKDFDFTKYENLSKDELQSYLLNWDDNNQKVIKGDNLIEDIDERTYVNVYRLLKLDDDFVNTAAESEKKRSLDLNN